MTFELERFVWTAPDRLELAGRFLGLGDAPLGAPGLAVPDGDSTHWLPVLADESGSPPVDKERWCVTFCWQEAPVAFNRAELHLGPETVVELPGPDMDLPAGSRPALKVRQEAKVPGTAVRREEGEADPAIDPGNGRPQLESELSAARDELARLRAVSSRTEKELLAAQSELTELRQRNAADAARFREGLAAIRASAEDALRYEQEAAEQTRARLHRANEQVAAVKGEIAQQQKAFDEADLQRTQAQVEARSHTNRLAMELEEMRQHAAGARAQAERAEADAASARAKADVLLARLQAVHAVLDGDG